jgi:hypothetical protein
LPQYKGTNSSGDFQLSPLASCRVHTQQPSRLAYLIGGKIALAYLIGGKIALLLGAAAHVVTLARPCSAPSPSLANRRRLPPSCAAKQLAGQTTYSRGRSPIPRLGAMGREWEQAVGERRSFARALACCPAGGSARGCRSLGAWRSTARPRQRGSAHHG